MKKSRRAKKIVARKISKLRLSIVVGLLLFTGVGSYLVFFSNAAPTVPNDFTKLGVHPQATNQPTATGKIIAALKSWNGKLYAGYGDYGYNSGPIAITPFDPSTSTFAATPEFSSNSHANYLFRIINDKLYAPAAQPIGADYAVGTSVDGAASWQDSPVGLVHAFDILTLNGSDLWLIGSSGYNSDGYGTATVWHKASETVSWQRVLDVPPRQLIACSSGNNFARFYGGIVHAGKLYVQATDWCSSLVNVNSKVFDPATGEWTDGPSFGQDYNTFHHGETFAGKTIFASGGYHLGTGAASLKTFDGSSMEFLGTPGIRDYTIDRATNTIYILTTGSQVQKSQDLVNWTLAATTPATARSIAIHNGVIYLGGTDSAIYKQKETTSGGGGATNDTQAPEVTISSPKSTDPPLVLASRTTIQASASDNVKVTRMEIYDGPTLLKTSTTGTIKYGWNTRNIASGSHTITVKAYDDAGNVGQASVTVSK